MVVKKAIETVQNIMQLSLMVSLILSRAKIAVIRIHSNWKNYKTATNDLEPLPDLWNFGPSKMSQRSLSKKIPGDSSFFR